MCTVKQQNVAEVHTWYTLYVHFQYFCKYSGIRRMYISSFFFQVQWYMLYVHFHSFSKYSAIRYMYISSRFINTSINSSQNEAKN